jgi:hypothetical protein
MKFLTLLKKELRECLPWTVLAAAFLLIIGSIWLRDQMLQDIENQYRVFERYSMVQNYELVKRPLGDIGLLTFVSAVGLGLALGVRQFWIDDFMGTWGFILHRSSHRTTILSAKIFAGLISLIAAIGLAWCYLFWRANLLAYLLAPLSRGFFIKGWLIIGTGIMFYLGAGLAGLSKAKWYTTKVMGLGFALWMFITLTAQWQLAWGFGTLAIGAAVLLCLMWEKFLNRQFT